MQPYGDFEWKFRDNTGNEEIGGIFCIDMKKAFEYLHIKRYGNCVFFAVDQALHLAYAVGSTVQYQMVESKQSVLQIYEMNKVVELTGSGYKAVGHLVISFLPMLEVFLKHASLDERYFEVLNVDDIVDPFYYIVCPTLKGLQFVHEKDANGSYTACRINIDIAKGELVMMKAAKCKNPTKNASVLVPSLFTNRVRATSRDYFT